LRMSCRSRLVSGSGSTPSSTERIVARVVYCFRAAARCPVSAKIRRRRQCRSSTRLWDRRSSRWCCSPSNGANSRGRSARCSPRWTSPTARSTSIRWNTRTATAAATSAPRSANEIATPTIPQIFVGGEHIGGCTETLDAFNQGRLQDPLVKNGIAFKAKKVDAYSYLPKWVHPRHEGPQPTSNPR